MAYVQNPPDAVATTDTGTDCPTIYDAIEENQGANGTIWFLILLTLFLIIALSAATVRRSLERAAHAIAEDDDAPYAVRLKAWAWETTSFVSILGLFVVAYLVVIGYQTLMGIGVYQGYTPDQPVKFIHSVHVCENEVDCQYCHHSAYESKHAGIPSTNVCMNCHKAVKKGSRYGEVEIGKIYAAIGFDPESGTYLDGEGQRTATRARRTTSRVSPSNGTRSTTFRTTCSSATSSTWWWAASNARTATATSASTPWAALPRWRRSTLGGRLPRIDSTVQAHPDHGMVHRVPQQGGDQLRLLGLLRGHSRAPQG